MAVDIEKFRLRRFAEKLVQEGECIVRDQPIDLIDVAGVLDCNAKAVWFRAVGPERTELVGNIMGSRRRLARQARVRCRPGHRRVLGRADDWALATRFQADRDFVVASGFRCVPLDPSLQGSRTGAKAGFDCTKPFGKGDSVEFTVPTAPQLPARPSQSLEAALAAGPATYLDLMAALGTRDGREVVRAFGELYDEGRLTRLKDGRYTLNGKHA